MQRYYSESIMYIGIMLLEVCLTICRVEFVQIMPQTVGSVSVF